MILTFRLIKKENSGANKIQWPDDNQKGNKTSNNDDNLDLYS